jgi:hypothetical protein
MGVLVILSSDGDEKSHSCLRHCEPKAWQSHASLTHRRDCHVAPRSSQ